MRVRLVIAILGLGLLSTAAAAERWLQVEYAGSLVVGLVDEAQMQAVEAGTATAAFLRVRQCRVWRETDDGWVLVDADEGNGGDVVAVRISTINALTPLRDDPLLHRPAVPAAELRW
jgi:hypothetical protein